MRLFVLVAFVLGPAVLLAQRHYVCYTAAKPPVIDGVEDAVWKAAPWTEEFADIEGGLRPAPTFKTRTKMLWDKDNLYLYAELQEPDLWATLLQHDTIIYLDNDFEVFIDP